MVLVLRHDAYLAEMPDAAFVLTHRGSHAFAGKSVFPLLERIVPHLDGRHTMAELLEPLSGERREMVRKLVTGLLERDIVRDVAAATPQDSHPEVRFIGYFRDDPGKVFEKYRTMSVLVLGNGPLVAPVVAACLRSGLRDIVHDADPVSLRSQLTTADLVFHVSGQPMGEHTALIENLCQDNGIPLAQAVAADDDAWFGMIGAEWTSAWHRLAERKSGSLNRVGTAVAGRSAHLLAARLVHGMFRLLTTPAETGTTIIRIDRRTSAGETITCLPHPFARPAQPDTAAEFTRRIRTLAGGPRLAEETFSQQTMACVDERLGVFGRPTEREFAQSPLHVCQIEVAGPAGQGPTHVTGAGLDFATARYRACLQAFARYGSRMTDPRRLTTAEGLPLPGSGEDPAQALAALRSNQLTAFTWAYDLVADQPVLVDAARVFSFTDKDIDGVAAAYSWQDAVTAALVARCRQLTLQQLPSVHTELDIATAPLGERGDRYRAMLAAIGSVAVYDITGPIAVPTVICCLAGTYAGAGSGTSYQDAVVTAMEEALLQYQASVTGQREYAPPAVPAKHRGGSRQPLPVIPPLDADDLTTALQRNGYRPLAVPLDHDPEVAAIMPYTIRVVLTDEQ